MCHMECERRLIKCWPFSTCTSHGHDTSTSYNL